MANGELMLNLVNNGILIVFTHQKGCLPTKTRTNMEFFPGTHFVVQISWSIPSGNLT
jgi:hypothetical protein